jgi:hypothetical protein
MTTSRLSHLASRSSRWTPMAELSRLPPVQRRFRRSRTPSNRYPRSQPATRSGQAPCLGRESVVHFSHASRAERSSGKEVCGLHRGSPTKAHTHRVLVTAVLYHLRGVECYPKHLLALADRKKWASRPYSSSFSERLRSGSRSGSATNTGGNAGGIRSTRSGFRRARRAGQRTKGSCAGTRPRRPRLLRQAFWVGSSWSFRPRGIWPPDASDEDAHDPEYEVEDQ